MDSTLLLDRNDKNNEFGQVKMTVNTTFVSKKNSTGHL